MKTVEVAGGRKGDESGIVPISSQRIFRKVGIALFVATLALHWLRAPWVPAVSGDEVYFAEDAFYLLKEGRLRQPFLDNPQGMAERAYFPPVAVLAQATMMAIFGTTAFGVTAASSLCATILMGLFVLAAHRAGLRGGWCWLAGVAPLGFALAERRFTMVRMETWTAVFALAAIVFLDAGARSGLARRIWCRGAAGAAAVLGGLAYYPHGPFVALGISLALLVYLRGEGDRFASCAAFAVGAAVPGSLFLIWVAQAPEVFAAQYLGGQASLYMKWQHSLDAVVSAFRPDTIDDLYFWEIVLCCAVSSWVVVGEGGMARASAIAALTMATSFVVYALPSRCAPVAVLTVLALMVSVATAGPKWRAWGLGAMGALALAGLGRTALVAATAVLQRDGRDYSRVRDALVPLIQKDGKIASTQVGWLALRPICDDGRLLYFMTCLDESFYTRPTLMRGNDGWRSIRYFILNLGPGGAEAAYPWFKEALARGDIVPIQLIQPPFRPLPWAKTAPYRIHVYENLRYQPPRATGD